MKKKTYFLLLAAVVMFLVPVVAIAGDLEPSTSPGATMKTLQEVYDAASDGLNEREGFFKQLSITEPEEVEVITVPNGKRLVILQILTRDPYRSWDLKITSGGSVEQFLNQNIFGNYNGNYTFNVTFPDRCVTIEQNQTLSFRPKSTSSAYITIIGYLYNP